MSVEHLKEYAHRCTVEPELRARAKAIGFSNLDEHVRHGESLGLEFSTEDVMAYRSEVVGEDEAMAELGEDEMEQVAGGVLAVSVMVAAVVVGVGAGAVVGVGVGAGVGAGVGVVASADGGGW